MAAGLDVALALAADRLEHGDAAQQVRAASLARNSGPLDLAVELNPRLRRTPAAELISRELEWAAVTPRARLILSMPPQESKTSQCQMTVLRKMQHDPEKRNAIASYAVDLARTSGRFVRSVIEAHGSGVVDPATGLLLPDRLGLRVAQDHAAAGDWSLEGHTGALYAIGVGGGLTGRPVDGLLVIDDPVKDREQADSPVYREKVAEWRSAVAETRLGPDASLVLVMTRWHENDLAGRMIAEDLDLPEDQRELRIVNIPALAHPDVDDALEGVPGARDDEGWLISVRGRTTGQWRRIRRRVGERTFGALYQGTPRPLEGGIFASAWFAAFRAPTAPKMDLVAVGVDPADTGTGDEAGILVAGRTTDGRIPFLADMSGQLSQHQWARRACLAWVRWEATRIVQERNLGMRTSIPDAWAIIYRQARALTDTDGVDEALRLLDERGDQAAARESELAEVEPLVEAILDRGPNGPRVVSMVPKVSKRARAESAAGAFETGRAYIVGYLPELEFEAATWSEGQRSPGRLDTMAMLANHLEAPMQKATVATRPRRQSPHTRGPHRWMPPGQ